MSGTSSITGSNNNHRLELGGNFDIPSGTASIGGIRFVVDGTTTIDGTLSFTSVDGTKTFTDITVNTGGNWDNNSLEDFNIDGNIVANSGITWTGCSATIGCRYTIRTDATGVSGAGTVTFSDMRINDNVTYTNTGNLVITDDIDGQVGTGASLVNGNGGTLTLSENGTYSEITFTLNTVGNTVIYSGSANENINLGPFYDLEINMNTSTTLCQVNNADVTVNNNMTITQGRVRLQSAHTLAVTGNLTITTNGELEPNNTGAVANITGDIIMTGGIYDHNNGDVNITDDFLISGGTFTYTGTSTLDADQITVENTTLVLSGGTVTATNASGIGITINAGGLIDVNAATLNVTNDLSIANATAQLNPDNASTVVNISGDLLMSAGNYNHDAGDVNVTGDITITGGTFDIANSASTLDAVNMAITTGTATVTNGTLTLTGGLTTNSGSLTQAAGTVAVTGTYQVSGGTNDFNGGTLTIGALTVDGSQSINLGNVDLTAGGTSSISGTATVDGGTGAKGFNNVTLASSGNINITSDETVAIGGNLSMSGTSSLTGTSNNHIVTVTGTTAVTAGTGTIGGIQFNANGATTIDGTLAFSSTTGNKTFSDVTLNASGTWGNGTVTEVFTISGNLVNNGGTWTGCSDAISCPYTLTSGSGTMSGAGTFNFTDLVINTPASYTNNGTVVMTDNITGTGTFINGATGTLGLSENGAYTITTLTLNTVGNTVIYSGTVNEQIEVNASTAIGPFYDLEINMATSTTQADMNGQDVTVNNNMTITQGRVRLQSANTLTVTGNVTITTNGELEPNNAGAVANIGGDISMSGGLYDHNNGDVNITDDFLITGGTLTFTGTSTLDMDQMTIQDAQATFSGGTVTMTNAAADGITLNAAGVIILAAATLNVTNDLNIANATAEFSPNNVSAVANISGDLLMSAGLYDHNNGDVNVSGDIILTGGTMTMDDGGTPSTIDATDLTMTNATATLNEGVLTISNASGGVTLNTGAQLTGNNTSTLNVTNNLTMNGGEYSPNNTNHTGTISGDILLTSGTFDFNNGAVTATDMTVTTGTAALTAGTLDITNASGGLTIDGGLMNLNGAFTLTVTNNLAIAGGEFQPNNLDMVANIGGDLTMSTGTFDQNDGDINITGDLLITGGTMTMNEGATLNESTIDATDMGVQTGSVTLSEGFLTLSNAAGGLSVSNNGTVTVASPHVLAISGDFDVDGTGAADLNGGTVNFVNMDITTGGSANVSGPTITSTGTITVDNGTYTSDGNGGTYNYNNIDVNANGTWNATATYDPTVSGNLSNDGVFTGCSSTTGCDYTMTSATGTITGSAAFNSMSDIILNDGASYTNTNTGGFNITDRLATTSGAGSFTNSTNGAMSYGGTNGNWTVTNFGASATGNTVTYNRTTTNQLIQAPNLGTANEYYNLIIDKADGIDATTGAVLTIANQLTMTLGDIQMGGQDLVIADGATISGGGATSYIQDNGAGALRQLYSGAGATLSFPIGDADEYSPITAFTINSATFGASPFLEFSITDAEHPSQDTGNTGSGGDDVGTTVTDRISRFWTITPNDITSPRFDASYIYLDADISGTEANMAATIYRTHPTLAILDWLVAGSVNPTNNTVTITNVDAFGDLYAMDNSSSRLPIVLLSFEVEMIEEAVEINWSTAIEINNEIYTIERSSDGLSFEEILFKEGAGNSTETLFYSMLDKNPLEGRSYYRLKQTDFNGAFDYSDVRSVVYYPKSKPMNVYPNPLRGGEKLYIDISSAVKVIGIRNSQGQLMHTMTDFSTDTKTVELTWRSEWLPGLYLITLQGVEGTEVKKLIVR